MFSVSVFMVYGTMAQKLRALNRDTDQRRGLAVRYVLEKRKAIMETKNP
jgi:hypothetical protein